MGILGGGFWVKVKFKDYSSRSTYIHIYFEFWLWEAFNMFNIYMYWERNPLIAVCLVLFPFVLVDLESLHSVWLTGVVHETMHHAFGP